MRNYLIIFLVILTLSAGQLLWKLGINQAGGFMANGESMLTSLVRLASNVYFLLGSVAYVVATLGWFYLLARYPFSYVYPFIALVYVFGLLGARFFLGESISVGRWIAVGFICLGVLLIART